MRQLTDMKKVRKLQSEAIRGCVSAEAIDKASLAIVGLVREEVEELSTSWKRWMNGDEEKEEKERKRKEEEERKRIEEERRRIEEEERKRKEEEEKKRIEEEELSDDLPIEIDSIISSLNNGAAGVKRASMIQLPLEYVTSPNPIPVQPIHPIQSVQPVPIPTQSVQFVQSTPQPVQSIPVLVQPAPIPVQPVPVSFQPTQPVQPAPIQVQPTSIPVQSIPQPVQPISIPVEPTPQPVQPIPQPVQSTPQPVQSTPQPVQPTSVPVQPTSIPVQPAPRPTQPIQPVQPTSIPVQPAPQPIQPTPQPVEPIPQPVQPTPQPVEPIPQPVQPTPIPVQPTPQPVEPIPQPVQSTPQPIQPVPIQVQPTSQPVQPTLPVELTSISIQPTQPVQPTQPIQPTPVSITKQTHPPTTRSVNLASLSLTEQLALFNYPQPWKWDCMKDVGIRLFESSIHPSNPIATGLIRTLCKKDIRISKCILMASFVYEFKSCQKTLELIRDNSATSQYEQILINQCKELMVTYYNLKFKSTEPVLMAAFASIEALLDQTQLDILSSLLKQSRMAIAKHESIRWSPSLVSNLLSLFLNKEELERLRGSYSHYGQKGLVEVIDSILFSQTKPVSAVQTPAALFV